MTAEAPEQQQTTSVTPSGIEVLYQWEPKRLYRLRKGHTTWDNDGTAIDNPWLEVPSVTTVLEVLDKPALKWWGMTVGVGGVIALHNQGVIERALYGGQHVLACPAPIGHPTPLQVADVGLVVDLLTKHKLTVNHVRDEASKRGLAVHDALEIWAEKGALPDPEMFPPEEQGYVMGLLAFLNDVPTAEPELSEVMVGSLEHGYAGRYDLRFKTTEPHRVVYHRTPVRGAKYAELPAGRFLLDLKTSKGVYPSHSRQLEAYEQASVECGYEPTDARGILHVSADGTYEFVRSTAEFEDFRVVLDVWKSDRRMAERKAK